MVARASLGQFEQLILTAVAALQEEAYGLEVYSKVCEMAGREMNLGSMYVTLERLKKKGYVSSKVAEGGAERGGRPRHYFKVLPAGAAALRESVDTATRISGAISELDVWQKLGLKV